MTEHYSDGRRYSEISKAWILLSSWNDTEEIASLKAEVERLKELLQRRARIGDEDRALALDLRAQLAAVEGHLEAQRTATYQAVEREHAAKARVTALEEALKAIDIRAKLGIAVYQIGDDRKDGWWMTDFTYEQLLRNLDAICEQAQQALTKENK